MSVFFSRPNVQKTLRYTAAYLLYAAAAILGLIATEWTRTDVLGLCTVLNVDRDITYLMYSWGSYLLYLPYVLLVAALEPYMNSAAKNGHVLKSAKKVFLIEGGVALVAFILTQVFASLHIPSVF
jgi:hypothetical protein